MFDKRRAEELYLNSATYHQVVDALVSILRSHYLGSGEVHMAVEHAFRRADELAREELERRAPR